MTAVIVPRVTPTSYPLATLFSDICAALRSCCTRPEDAFRRVVINKLDENGQAKSYTVTKPNSQETMQVKDLLYIEEIRTGDLYKNEPRLVVGFKCFAIFMAMPLYVAGTIAWHSFQFLRSIGAVFWRIVEQILHMPVDAKQIFCSEIQVLPEICLERMWAIFSAPFFGLSAALFSLCGVVKPLEMRTVVAMIEKAWHDGISYKKDVCQLPNEGTCCGTITSNRDQALFLAHCFQARGNVKRNVNLISTQPLEPFCGDHNTNFKK
ncbi:MAG TPA: hypothetical protein VGJ00_08010 [Rhabdochlamydiaceae bacterium]|jgi:hypothetical protein